MTVHWMQEKLVVFQRDLGKGCSSGLRATKVPSIFSGRFSHRCRCEGPCWPKPITLCMNLRSDVAR